LFEEFGAALFSERTRLGLAAQNETVEGTQSAVISWAARFFDEEGRIDAGSIVPSLRRYLAEKVGLFAVSEAEAAVKRRASIAAIPAGPAQPRAESESVPGWGEYVMPLLSPERVEALNSTHNPTARYRGEPFKFYAQAEYFAFREKELGHLEEDPKALAYAESSHPFFRKFGSAFDWIEFRSRQASEIQARLDSQKKHRRGVRR
jgi:hypothetical protein